MSPSIPPVSGSSSGPSSAGRVAHLLAMRQQFDSPTRDEAINSQAKSKTDPVGPRDNQADLLRNLLSHASRDHAPRVPLPNDFVFGVQSTPIPVTGRRS